MGFARHPPPLRLCKKNVRSKEPTFANGFRLLTRAQPCGRQRSFRGTGRQSFDPWGLLRSPSRSPRSCQSASGLPRHSACTLSFTRAQKSATSYVGLMGVPTHICAVGLYCKATRAHLRHARAALATKPRSASLVPKGSLSLTQKIIFLFLNRMLFYYI